MKNTLCIDQKNKELIKLLSEISTTHNEPKASAAS